MAIIYTYPKLTDPQGNELIVVSDVNNRNATRLITIASIAALVPSGGGCGTAINGIITGAGDYIAPLCNDVTFVGSGVDISADQATATVTFTVPPYELPCPTLETKGGITAEVLPGTDPPGAAASGTYYPVQIIDSNCSATVRVPDAELPVCATALTAGIIKVGAAATSIDPTLGTSDTNILVEVNDQCQAYVPIPDNSITCANATTLGGVKALENTTETVMPVVPEDGTYYSIEVVKAPGAATDDECRAIVKIPESGGGGCEDVWKTIDIPSGSFDASGCDDTLTLTSSGGSIDITSAVQGTVNFDVEESPCASTTKRGGVIVATDDTGTDPQVDEEGVAYALEVNTTCEAFVRIPDTKPNKRLLYSTVWKTTNTNDQQPPAFQVPHLAATTTLFQQLDFNPTVDGTGGSGTEPYGVCERPADANAIVRVVIKMFVVTLADKNDETIMIGLHHDNTDQQGVNLTYNWQGIGDYDVDDLASGDNLQQVQFTFDTTASELLNIEGNPATAGENCYFYVKAIFDSSNSGANPVIAFGRRWPQNPSTTTASNLFPAGPMTVDVYEIDDNAYGVNLVPA